MLLEFKDVEVLYGNVILALKGVSLEVSEGQYRHHLGAPERGRQDNDSESHFRGFLMLENGRVNRGGILFQGRRIDGMDPAEIARVEDLPGHGGPGDLPLPHGGRKFKGGEPHARRGQKRNPPGPWNSSCPIFHRLQERKGQVARHAERGGAAA